MPTPDPTGGAAAVLRWSARAQALDPAAVVAMTADGRLAWWNLRRAASHYVPLLDAFRAALPGLD